MGDEALNAAECVRQILDVFDLKANDFADRIGVKPAAVSHMVTGRNNPSYDVLQRILGAFPEINPGWLILGKGEMLVTSEGGREPQADAPRGEGNQPDGQPGVAPSAPAIPPSVRTGNSLQGTNAPARLQFTSSAISGAPGNGGNSNGNAHPAEALGSHTVEPLQSVAPEPREQSQSASSPRVHSTQPPPYIHSSSGDLLGASPRATNNGHGAGVLISTESTQGLPNDSPYPEGGDVLILHRDGTYRLFKPRRVESMDH